MTTITALDLFAGTGWGVAAQRLGIEEYGVEIMPEARATREAAGMTTIYSDVWDGLAGPTLVPDHDLLIASPPCQTFSMAGKGAGRQALDDVLGLIASGAWDDSGTALRETARGAGLDDRTALVLSPLAYIATHGPSFVALEQVPTVLPVWEVVGEALRDLGYSVAVGVLNAEQYGVPQTRRRAILVARRDGQEAALPAPTHSRYYSRDPKRLDEGLLPWVSMAEALGWGMTARPSVTITGGSGRQGGPDPRDGGSGARATLRTAREAGAWLGALDRRATLAEAAILQSYPSWPFERPAPTVVGTRRSEGGMLIGRQLDDGSRRDQGGRQTDVGLRDGMLPGVRVSGDQGAALQSYPGGFPFQGSNSKKFLQIGNAVPPLLAEAILRTFL